MIGRVIEGSRPGITFTPAAGRLPQLGLRRINAFRMGAADLAGQGGLSRVFKEAGRCGTPVAVKVGQPFSDGGIAALENEAAVLAELRHPHIIDFLGQGALRDNTPFIASDLKPDNIFYESRPHPATVKVFDFGLARLRGEWLAIERSADGSFFRSGVYAYMNVGKLADKRPPQDEDDIFALGLILFEMVTGQRALNGCDCVAWKGDYGRMPQRLEYHNADPTTRELILKMVGLGDKPRIMTAQEVIDYIEDNHEAIRNLALACPGGAFR